jgi:uncharacterized protein (TIGR03118 family)
MLTHLRRRFRRLFSRAPQDRSRRKWSRLSLEVLEERCVLSTAVAGSFFQQTNLVADIPGLAANTDPRLLNPWGVALGADGLFRIDDNHAGLATVYDANGNPQPGTVAIPLPPGAPAGSGPAAPDGAVNNPTAGFVISEGGRSSPATTIFATEDGTITAFNAQVDSSNALIVADNSATGAVYKALTLASTAGGTFIYATNFHNGTVDVFDSNFHQVHLAGFFTDPNLPAGFAPFGIKNVNGTIFVTYAKQLAPDNHDDQAGPGNGFIDEFTTDGQLIERFASGGALNSPHGLALAPANFGAFSNDLLVGNFGDGRINAFNLASGTLSTSPPGSTVKTTACLPRFRWTQQSPSMPRSCPTCPPPPCRPSRRCRPTATRPPRRRLRDSGHRWRR